MKIRSGFVSNSSSSSFVVRHKGTEITLEVYEEEDDKLIDLLNKMKELKLIKDYKEGDGY